jgi:hypothetical protein
MTFIGFVKQVVKMLFGYVGGFVSLLVSVGLFAQGNSILGAIFFVVAFILGLFGIYTEREI